MHPPALLEPYKYSNSPQQVPRTLATAREINEVPLSSKPRAHAACKQRELCKAPFPSSSPWMASAPRERQGAPPVSSHSSNLRQGAWAAAPHRTTISYTPSHLADPPDHGVVWDQKKKTWHGCVCVNNDICKWLGLHNRSSGTLCIWTLHKGYKSAN